MSDVATAWREIPAGRENHEANPMRFDMAYDTVEDDDLQEVAENFVEACFGDGDPCRKRESVLIRWKGTVRKFLVDIEPDFFSASEAAFAPPEAPECTLVDLP